MKKKIFLQIFLFLIIVFITVIFYKIYFVDKNISKNTEINIDKKNLDEKKTNLIHNIEYISTDKVGNSYIIKSEFGELDNNQPELVLMKKVIAIIKLKDSEPINISANNAIYNKDNYETNFFENVLVTYNQHIITSKNLDLILEKNLATISNDIIYKNLNTELQADKVEMDLTTKNSKIFMNDKSKKIKIVSLD